MRGCRFGALDYAPPMLFGILLGIDALAALVVVGFFMAGIADGSVSSFNMLLWLGLLAGTAAVIGGGLALKAGGQPRLANLVLAILAGPSFLFGLFFLMLILIPARWN